jgi:hypothetical protein
MADVIPGQILVSGSGRKYTVKEKLPYDGDLADFYSCTFGDGSGPVRAVLKITRDLEDNDLVTHEAAILSVLFPRAQEDKGLYLALPEKSRVIGK